MSKELEALKSIKREAGVPYFSTLYDIDMWREDFATVETALKALEVIKEKRVDVDDLIESVNLEEYNRHMSFCYGSFLTQEEYDLLKEVLCSEN